MAPDLCVTAAYGGMLPQAFLDLPRLGTINVHPSLLPKYRGAAPVQRALEKGEPETGVSLVYTVLRMDAGPVPELNLKFITVQSTPTLPPDNYPLYNCI